MKSYQFEDFTHENAWLIFRLDANVQHQPIDIYLLLDLRHNLLVEPILVESELSQEEADHLIATILSNDSTPSRLLLANGDPAESVLKKSIEKTKIKLEMTPAPYLENLTAYAKKTWGQHCSSLENASRSSAKDNNLDDLDNFVDFEEVDNDEYQSVQRFLPDSYDPCSCASNKKYKFCCKKIVREISETMVAAEEGNLTQTLQWIEKAGNIVGDTPEILCREAIIYSFFDAKKSNALLKKCLKSNPNHPRAHYICGINFKMEGNLPAAILSYEKAIANYPLSDHYHLNEAYNNLGTAFYMSGNFDNAKAAWEKGLLHMLSDKMTRKNLEFINKRTMGAMDE